MVAKPTFVNAVAGFLRMRLAADRTLAALRENVLSWSVILAAILAAATLFVTQFVLEPLDGETTGMAHVWTGDRLLHFVQGVLIGALIVVVPLMMLARRNAQLRRAQRELSLTSRDSRTAFYTWDVRHDRARGWGTLRAVFAMPNDDPNFAPSAWMDIVHPDDVEVYRAAVRDHFQGRSDQMLVDYRIRDREGGYRWVRDKAIARRDVNGRVLSVEGTVDEITELKETEQALRESEARATLALLASNSRIWQWDIVNGIAHRTRRCAEILGIDEDDVSGSAAWWLDVIHEDDRAGYKAAIRAHLKGETDRYEAEYRVRRADGACRWVLDRGLALRDASGRAYRMAGVLEDVTERRNTDEALKRMTATFKAFLENAPMDIAVKDTEGRYLLFNRSACERFGVNPADVVGKTPADFMGSRVAAYLDAQDAAVFEAGEPVVDERRHELPGQPPVDMVHVRFPIFGEDGSLFGLGAVAQDVSEARAAERELKEQKEQLQTMADALPAKIVYIDRDRRIRFINRTAEQWWGLTRDAVVGQLLTELPGQDHYRSFDATLDRVFAGEIVSMEDEIVCADGRTRQVDRRYVPHVDARGGVIGIYGMAIDVTEKRAVAERLRQSQKMEAVGNLTGGIAHDFNNLMFAVAGNLEFLEEELAATGDAQCRRFVANARKGVTRAADLTARLLAFSRRQTLRPENVEVVALFGDLRELLRRTLPENIDIHTRVDIEDAPVIIDAGQLESSLLNLAINARDAMPDGGDLTFHIDSVTVAADECAAPQDRAPGPYIRIRVTDSGCGMPPEIVDKAFEPFFTTKEIGQGTGLGLSMVHGFVEQSGGFVEVDSEVGRGTTVSLLLPLRRDARRAETADRGKAHDDAAPRGSVLLVEDDAMVREVASLYLDGMGYSVTTAADGAEALALLDAGSRFDLILSDVMMPNGLSGVTLAERARRLDPDQPILLMTGYTDRDMPARAGPGADIPLVQKPFNRAVLASAVAAAVEARAGGRQIAQSAA